MTLTQFAPVAGIQVYEQMMQASRLGNYHLLLAHDILARPDRYHEVFGKYSVTHHGRSRTVILDNSVAELGVAEADIEKIAHCANAVQATVIVLPDVYKKGPETIESCANAYNPWLEYLTEHLTYTNWSFMMVPQGRTLEEFASCAEYFADSRSKSKWDRIHWWGIPRNLVEITGFWANNEALGTRNFQHGSRRLGMQMCARLAPYRAIHMLGFSDSIIDDWDVVRHGGYFIRGIDSAVPLRAATVGTRMSWNLSDLGPRPEGWLENAEYTELMQENIDYAQWLFSGA